MPQGLYCAEEVQRPMKPLNGKCQNKRTEEEKTQGSTEKPLETEKLNSPDDLDFFIPTTSLVLILYCHHLNVLVNYSI